MAHDKHGRWIRHTLRWSIIVLLLTAGAWYMILMPGKSWSGPVPRLSPEEQVIHDRLQQHVGILAQQIGERNVWNADALAASAAYIQTTLQDLGYGVNIQSYDSQGISVQNLEIEIAGSTAPQEIVVIGAHYDTVEGGPGANDNASGVAALLELARLLAGNPPARTLRLVAFVNEEQPFSSSKEMGSQVYAERSRQRGDQVKAMISLETIGHYNDEPGSQHYPFPFNYFYPDSGNFIGFVGNLSSFRLVRQSVDAFRAATAFPSEGVAAPGWVTGVGWSDHASFWQAGYPAIMITDTALFRYPHYHEATDTPDKLDYRSLARVTRGLLDVVVALAGQP